MNPRTARGFTLVELLLTVTIIALISAATIPSFVGYIKNQGVRQAQESLKSDLRSSQNKSLTGASSNQTIGGNPVLYWGVKLFRSAGATVGKYEYFIAANNTSCAYAATELQGSSNLPQNVEFKIAGDACIFFSLANGGISYAGSVLPSAGNITRVLVGYVNENSAGSCRSVYLNPQGLIYSTNLDICT
jgi:prepilin-type N-terminal cleavage/methylation domain-containing protein